MRRGRPRHDDILTPREWEVLHLLGERLTNEQIAARLGISLSAVKYHVGEILSKLDASSRQEAVRIAGQRRTGLLATAPLAWLRSLLLAKPALTAVVGVTAGVALTAFLITTPWAGEKKSEQEWWWEFVYPDAGVSPDLAPVDQEAFAEARLASPYPHTILFTKTEPGDVGEAAAIIRSLPRVTSLAELQAVLTDDVNVIVLDRSAADEVRGIEFLAHQMRSGRAIIQLNVCLEEVFFHGYIEPEPQRAGVVTEISPSGESREIEVSGSPVPTYCDNPFAQTTGVFHYRRITTIDQPDIPRPDENKFDARGGGRMHLLEFVLRDLDAGRELREFP